MGLFEASLLIGLATAVRGRKGALIFFKEF
jgi:hypothetical protein